VLLVGGWTKESENDQEIPFVSIYSKKGGSEYMLTGTAVLSSMKGTLTCLELMPKKQNDCVFFLCIDLYGNLGVYRTNGVSFDQVFFYPKYHTGKLDLTRRQSELY
jgi:hypothetical protein